MTLSELLQCYINGDESAVWRLREYLEQSNYTEPEKKDINATLAKANGTLGGYALEQLLYNIGSVTHYPEKAAFDCYWAAAQSTHNPNNGRAKYLVGLCFFHGQGTEQNIDKALYWTKAAGDLGYAHALYELANYYEEEENAVDYAATIRAYYEAAAQLGYAPAQFNLGQLLEKEDPVRAVAEYEKAAQQGYLAHTRLGRLYSEGFGTQAPDPQRARDYFMQAASMGSPEGLYNMGLAYEFGRLGDVPNLTIARKYYVKSLYSAQSPTSIFSLRKLHDFYLNGKGELPKSSDCAERCEQLIKNFNTHAMDPAFIAWLQLIFQAPEQPIAVCFFYALWEQDTQALDVLLEAYPIDMSKLLSPQALGWLKQVEAIEGAQAWLQTWVEKRLASTRNYLHLLSLSNEMHANAAVKLIKPEGYSVPAVLDLLKQIKSSKQVSKTNADAIADFWYKLFVNSIIGNHMSPYNTDELCTRALDYALVNPKKHLGLIDHCLRFKYPATDKLRELYPADVVRKRLIADYQKGWTSADVANSFAALGAKLQANALSSTEPQPKEQKAGEPILSRSSSRRRRKHHVNRHQSEPHIHKSSAGERRPSVVIIDPQTGEEFVPGRRPPLRRQHSQSNIHTHSPLMFSDAAPSSSHRRRRSSRHNTPEPSTREELDIMGREIRSSRKHSSRRHG